MYNRFLKRTLDILLSGLIILSLFPILILVAIWIKYDSEGPVFFIQERIGMGLKGFQLMKFRSMTNEKRKVSVSPVIGRAEGVTRIGYWLRRFKIDEIPQLFNVLRGEMSLVGPRPSIREHLERMTDEEKERYRVRPGLTGLAQISGNIHISWKERYIYDLQYVRNISFPNDLRILLRTGLIVIRGEELFIHKTIKIYERKKGAQKS